MNNTHGVHATKDDYKSVIYAGCFVERNGVSICNIQHYVNFRNRPQFGKRYGKYQVWSDRHRVYDLYHNVDEAVDKFIELTNKR